MTEPRPLDVTLLAGTLVLEGTWRGPHSQDHGSAQDTRVDSSFLTLCVNMSRLLQRVVHREGYVASVNQTAQRRTEHLCLSKEKIDEERESVTIFRTLQASHAALAHVKYHSLASHLTYPVRLKLASPTPDLCGRNTSQVMSFC